MGRFRGKRRKILLLTVLLLFGAAAGYAVYENSHVRFADENMGLAICAAAGSGVTPENVKYKDLKKIQRLNAGYLGNFDTLKDIKKCRNIEELLLNGASFDDASIKVVNDGQIGRILKEQEVQRVEEELAEIVPQLGKLKILIYTNSSGNCDITNWGFLEKSRKLDTLYIQNSATVDFAFLSGCTNLQEVDLWGSDIQTADALVQMKELKKLIIYDTPLAEDEKELEKLCNALPDTEIYISGGRVEHKQKK